MFAHGLKIRNNYVSDFRKNSPIRVIVYCGILRDAEPTFFVFICVANGKVIPVKGYLSKSNYYCNNCLCNFFLQMDGLYTILKLKTNFSYIKI